MLKLTWTRLSQYACAQNHLLPSAQAMPRPLRLLKSHWPCYYCGKNRPNTAGFHWPMLALVPASTPSTGGISLRWLAAALSLTADIRHWVPTAKMKHYEVSGVYETLNRQWAASWCPNLINQISFFAPPENTVTVNSPWIVKSKSFFKTLASRLTCCCDTACYASAVTGDFAVSSARKWKRSRWLML